MPREEIKELTKKLVSFRSTKENQEELQRCSDFIAGYFRNEDVYVKRFEKNDVPSVYASLKDTNNPTILFNAHFDVVPAIENLFMAEEEDNVLKGRGVIDDKGPLAILMVLIKHLSKLEEKPNVALLATGDEETGGFNGAQHALEQGIMSEFAIVADGGSLNKYVTKAKGVLQLKLTAKGMGGHSSRPWEGVNALEKLIIAYEEIKGLFEPKDSGAWERTINLSTMKGGEAPNKIPGQAEMLLDIRYTDYESPTELLNKIKGICEEVGAIDVEVLENSDVFFSEEDNPHLQILLDVSEDVLGQEPVLTYDHGGSDARFFSTAGMPSVVTAPLGGNYHSDDEYLDLEHVDEFFDIMKEFVLRVCSTEAAGEQEMFVHS